MEARKIENLFFVYIEELTISRLYEHYREFFVGYSMLIACLDSCRDLNSLSKWKGHLKENNISYKIIKNAFMFDEESMKKLFNLGKTFYHFDEVYLFKNNYPDYITDKQFTSEINPFNSKIKLSFFNEIKKMGAIRYLSDGCGLNLASETKLDINKLISIQQMYLSKEDCIDAKE